MKNEMTERFRIRSYEMNAAGVASVQTICNYLQEIASLHAARLGVAVDVLFKKNLTWVLSRLHLKMDHYPTWGDEVIVETWPSGMKGLFATREFIVYDYRQNKIGLATTSWMILDLKKQKPIKMPDFIEAIDIPEYPRAIDDDFKKLPPLIRSDAEKQFNVRYSDLDINQHVNNVNFIEWAIESVPPEIFKKKRMTDLEIGFRAESRYGDRIIARTQVEKDRCLHNLLRQHDQREVALVRTRWV